MPIASDEERCEVCRFFEDCTPAGLRESQEKQIGQCRKLPPKLTRRRNEDGLRDFGRWPFVYIDQWCGSFEDRSERGPQL